MYWIEKLKDLGLRRGWSEHELANELGVRKSHLDEVLRGDAEPSLQLKMRAIDLIGYDKTRSSLLWLLPSDLARTLESQDLARGKRTSMERSDQVVEDLLAAIEAALKVHDETALEQVILAYLRKEEHS